MVCEKCGTGIESSVCAACGESILALGPYCYLCGNPASRGEAVGGEEEVDFSARILCSDDACIGVVNEQGVCKVCGKPYLPE